MKINIMTSILGKGTLAKGGITLGLLAASLQLAQAQIPYPNSGSYNPVTYSFTAASSGDIIAYIVGGFSAGFDNELGLNVNGVSTGIFGLDNHSSAVGNSLNLGHANAGDSLIFVLKNNSLGENAYSDASLNASYDAPGDTSGHNHIYSAPYTGTPAFSGVPNGTYVAFEDLPFPGTDFNYDDESFVFGNVATRTSTDSVPDATSTAALLGASLPLLALARRKFRC